MIAFTITLTGVKPLLMHNARLADPLDSATKALRKYTSKKQKTEEDHEAVAHLEWIGSLYHDPDVGIYIPGPNVFKTLVEGARLTKSGKKIERGVIIKSDVNPLSYNGSRDPEALFQDSKKAKTLAENFIFKATIKVGQQRVVRTRPMFHEWKVQAEGIADPSMLDLDNLAAIAETAGNYVGLGDWRPRFGRFEAKVEAA